jgi:hypothetical protein
MRIKGIIDKKYPGYELASLKQDHEGNIGVEIYNYKTHDTKELKTKSTSENKQGVAEGSRESVSFREMVNVVDEHDPKYYAELSGSDISDKQFEQKIINAYKKIMQKQGMA